VSLRIVPAGIKAVFTKYNAGMGTFAEVFHHLGEAFEFAAVIYAGETDKYITEWMGMKIDKSAIALFGDCPDVLYESRVWSYTRARLFRKAGTVSEYELSK